MRRCCAVVNCGIGAAVGGCSIVVSISGCGPDDRGSVPAPTLILSNSFILEHVATVMYELFVW
jgi:hypothetical protein